MDQHELTKKNNRIMIEADRKREGQRVKRVSGDFQFAIDRSHSKAVMKSHAKADALKKKTKSGMAHPGQKYDMHSPDYVGERKMTRAEIKKKTS